MSNPDPFHTSLPTGTSKNIVCSALWNLIRESEYSRTGDLPSNEQLNKAVKWWLRFGSDLKDYDKFDAELTELLTKLGFPEMMHVIPVSETRAGEHNQSRSSQSGGEHSPRDVARKSDREPVPVKAGYSPEQFARAGEQEGDYRSDDCTQCGRMRVQFNGVCEKCHWNNDLRFWDSPESNLPENDPFAPAQTGEGSTPLTPYGECILNRFRVAIYSVRQHAGTIRDPFDWMKNVACKVLEEVLKTPNTLLQDAVDWNDRNERGLKAKVEGGSTGPDTHYLNRNIAEYSDLSASVQGETLSDRINALPEWVRQHIHDIETKCDPAGDIRTIGELRDNVAALEDEAEELKRAIENWRKQWNISDDGHARALRRSEDLTLQLKAAQQELRELEALRAGARTGMLKFMLAGDVGCFADRMRNLLQAKDWDAMRLCVTDFFNVARDITEVGRQDIEREYKRAGAAETLVGELRTALQGLIAENWYVLSGGDDPAEKCSECGCAGYGELRDKLKRAEELLTRTLKTEDGNG